MAWDQSRTARLLQTVEKRVRWVSDGSVLARGVESLATCVETLIGHSYVYRWLTATPEPNVIVIDLRETRIVGPFVRLAATVLESPERAWANSRLTSIATTVGWIFSASRTGRTLTALLEPPNTFDENDREAG